MSPGRSYGRMNRKRNELLHPQMAQAANDTSDRAFHLDLQQQIASEKIIHRDQVNTQLHNNAFLEGVTGDYYYFTTLSSPLT